MNLYHDVVVKGIDEESSELARTGSACDLVFALSDSPPAEWRDIFRRMAHARASSALEHARFNAGFVTVSIPLVQARGLAEDLVAVVRETNAQFRDEQAAELREEVEFAEVVQDIQKMLRARPA